MHHEGSHSWTDEVAMHTQRRAFYAMTMVMVVVIFIRMMMGYVDSDDVYWSCAPWVLYRCILPSCRCVCVCVCSKQIWVWTSGLLFLDECGLPLYIIVDVIQIPFWTFFMRGVPFRKSTFELSPWTSLGDVALMAVLIMRMVVVTVTVIMIVMVMNLVMRWSWWCVIIMMVCCADWDGDGHGEDDRWSWCWW